MPPSVSASIPTACAYWPGAAQGGSRTLIFDRSNKKIVVWMKVEERFEVYIKDLQEQIDILAYSSIALAG